MAPSFPELEYAVLVMTIPSTVYRQNRDPSKQALYREGGGYDMWQRILSLLHPCNIWTSGTHELSGV